MDWLFERTIELAAWVAFILGVIFLCEAIYMLYEYAIHLRDGGGAEFLAKSGQAATKFVGMSLALGLLACIDHYVFDIGE